MKQADIINDVVSRGMAKYKANEHNGSSDPDEIMKKWDAETKFALGFTHISSLNPGESPDFAVHLIEMSAEDGFMLAQYVLGNFYEEGYGGKSRDRNQAENWWRKAAAQGLDDAKDKLENVTASSRKNDATPIVNNTQSNQKENKAEKEEANFSFSSALLGMVSFTLLPGIIFIVLLSKPWYGNSFLMVLATIFFITFGFIWDGFKNTRYKFSFARALVGFLVGFPMGFRRALPGGGFYNDSQYFLLKLITWPIVLVFLIVFRMLFSYLNDGKNYFLFTWKNRSRYYLGIQVVPKYYDFLNCKLNGM